MPIIVIGSQKGGSSKSTSTVNLAVGLATTGCDVLIVDSDRQASSSEWWADRKESHPDKAKIHCVQKYESIDDTLLDLSSRYEYVLVDTAGRDSDALRAGMSVADMLLIPIKPSAVDLNTLPNMDKIIKESRYVNPKLKALAFLSIAPTNYQGAEIINAKQVISEYLYFSLMDEVVLFDRKIYRDSYHSGLGVLESIEKSDSIDSAKAEVMALTREVIHHGV